MGVIVGTHGYNKEEFSALQQHVRTEFNKLLDACTGPLVQRGESLIWTGASAAEYATEFSDWLTKMVNSTSAQFQADQLALQKFAVDLATILKSEPPAVMAPIETRAVTFAPQTDPNDDGQGDSPQIRLFAAFVMETFDTQVRPPIEAIIGQIETAVGSSGTAVRANPNQIDVPKATLIADMNQTITHLKTEFEKGAAVATSYADALDS
jgi:hypothetical protein